MDRVATSEPQATTAATRPVLGDTPEPVLPRPDDTSKEILTDRRYYPRLFGLVILVTVFGVGHHIDHVIRGKHIGWPLVAEATPFTPSLGSYPLVALWPYTSPMAGYAALSWLISFLLLLIGRAIYAARLLTRRQQAPLTRPAARGKKPTKRR